MFLLSCNFCSLPSSAQAEIEQMKSEGIQKIALAGLPDSRAAQMLLFCSKKRPGQSTEKCKENYDTDKS